MQSQKKLPGLLVIAAITALVFHMLRNLEMVRHAQFWAEDGTIFFFQDYTHGPAVFFNTYAGYLHLWPRIVAFFTGFFPILWAPAIYKIFALFTQLGLITIIGQPRFPGNRIQKALMILMTTFVPISGEIFLNLTNTISLCCVIYLAIMVTPPSLSILRRLLEFTILFVCACSGPTILFLLPVISIYCIWNGTAIREQLYRLTALTLAFAVQLNFVHLGARGGLPLNTTIGPWLRALTHFFKPLLLANTSLRPAWNTLSAILVAGLLLLFVGESLNIFKSNLCKYTRASSIRDFLSRMRISPSFFLMTCAFGIFASFLFIQKNHPDASSPFGNGGRYYYIPYLLMYWSIILDLGRTHFFRPRVLFLGVAFLSSIYSFHDWKMPAPNYNWPNQVRQFEQTGSYTFQILPSLDWKFHLDKTQCWRCPSSF